MHQLIRDEHHGEQARRGGGARNRKRGRRRLGYAIAVPARELFPHMLYDFPARQFAFKGLGHDLSELARPRAAAFAVGARRGLDNPFNRQIVRQIARPRGARARLFLAASSLRPTGILMKPKKSRSLSTREPSSKIVNSKWDIAQNYKLRVECLKSHWYRATIVRISPRVAL